MDGQRQGLRTLAARAISCLPTITSQDGDKVQVDRAEQRDGNEMSKHVAYTVEA
jgi:hypothetical protein